MAPCLTIKAINCFTEFCAIANLSASWMAPKDILCHYMLFVSPASKASTVSDLGNSRLKQVCHFDGFHKKILKTLRLLLPLPQKKLPSLLSIIWESDLLCPLLSPFIQHWMPNFEKYPFLANRPKWIKKKWRNVLGHRCSLCILRYPFIKN